MTVARIVHAFAGTLILLSVALALTIDVRWLYLAAFVGLNLLQSSITRWCLLARMLRAAGVRDEPQGQPAV